jgi:hypothetical protein
MLERNLEIYSAGLPIGRPPLATAEKIISFGSLPNGWHYGEGRAPDEKTIKSALAVFWQFHRAGFEDTDAFPGINKEIMITAYRGDHYLEVLVENNGTISFSYEFDGEDVIPPLERRAAAEIKERVEEVARGIWSTFGSYIAITSTLDRNRIASKVWHSKTLPTAVGRRWYSDLVSTPPA